MTDMNIESALSLHASVVWWTVDQVPLVYTGGGLHVARYWWWRGTERGGGEGENNAKCVYMISVRCSYVHMYTAHNDSGLSY